MSAGEAGALFTYWLTGIWVALAIAAHDSAVFDFLKRRREPDPQAWEPRQITFLAEQRGPAEDTIKSALRARFAADPRIRRAYLERAAYPNAGPQRSKLENRGPDGTAAPVEVVLCLAAPEDVGIVEVVGEEFRTIFGATQHLDTLFLTAALEADVVKVAAPFYSAQ